MSCGFSRETLALHVEGDLSSSDASRVGAHVAGCADCRRFVAELRDSQALLKSLRHDVPDPADCSAMRHEVMATIRERRYTVGWALRLERSVVLALRPRAYAAAACAIVGVLALSLVAQVPRPAARGAEPVEAADTLSRPEGYRTWVRLEGVREGASVYVDPSSYRAYEQSGTVPEGTLMLWEAAAPADTADLPHTNSPVLLAALKDSRKFDGGWGFFDFTAPGGGVVSRTRVLPEASGCRACHRPGASFLAYRG